MKHIDAQELINLSLDGELDAAGQDRLDQLLREDEQVRKEYEGSRQLFALLDEMPARESGRDIAAGVAAELAARNPAPATSRKSNVVQGQFGRRWKPALAMAASLIAAVAVVMVVENSPTTPSEQLMGTMAPSQVPAGWVTWDEDRLLLDIPGEGEFELQLLGEGLQQGQNNLFVEPVENGVRVTGSAPYREHLPVGLASQDGDIELILKFDGRHYRGRVER